MPAPIAISKTSPDVDSFGSPRNATSSSTTPRSSSVFMNGYNSSIMGASSGSFREAIAASFGKEASDIMDYSISRFSSSHASTDSDMTALPSTSYPRSKLETTFCRNFKCCGQGLENLHDLLQHYEESHVKFEDDDDMPAMVADDDNGSAASSSSASSSQPPSPKTITNVASTKAKDTFEESSAFDTTIMRSTPNKGGKKRSFGQFSNGSNSNNVHQSLRRALIDGGVGRGTSKASSVYSANSPFSTPGSSIPGTPTMDSDNETAFFSNGQTNIPTFSSLSIRGNNDDHDLPSCAPPNLFFPAAGSSSSLSLAPPAKRERMNSINSTASGSNNDSNGGLLGDRPYKCQSPGCDKAYKQMNGLKYHRLHGQCNQNNLPTHQQITNVTTESQPGSSTLNPTIDSTATISSKASPTSMTANNIDIDNDEVKSAIKSISSSSPSLSLNTTSAVASALAAAAAAMITNSSPIATNKNTNIQVDPEDISTPFPPNSTPSSPHSSPGSINGDSNKADRHYICQVGLCGKKYKNLNGLRYHYLHSGSHGLLGLQLLHTNGGGPSARADASTGRPAISTNDLSSTALAAAAQAAAAQQQANRRSVEIQKQQD